MNGKAITTPTPETFARSMSPCDEKLHYALLSDDPLIRWLAELAAAAEPWHDLPIWIEEGGPDAIEELNDQHGAMTHALDHLGAWDDARCEIDEPLLDWYKELAEDARSGKLYYVEDCANCDGEGKTDTGIGEQPCPECKGRGITLESPELP